MTRAAVLGAGSWGTTFAKVLADAGTDVVVWSRNPATATQIRAAHENPDYRPGVRLPDRRTETADAADAVHDADLVVVAVPSQTARENLAAVRPALPRGAVLVSLM